MYSFYKKNKSTVFKYFILVILFSPPKNQLLFKFHHHFSLINVSYIKYLW